ncbi:hypothetical protein N7539_007311 [Penicillium diatomitis]|uniref:Mitochondrial export translocase Oxa2 n=1 Tax=Penicillium diatomitis TaxID=2819901 RepID=A0A9W9WVA7_9EURO|nr:uncharacterized protein N7539_007311 [Penicillium diatomitis]KAJ5477167.1 hypothetical protein N7539_007311 [Penicillium diatomitis]
MNSLRLRTIRIPRSTLALTSRSHVRKFHPTKPTPWINEALDASAVVIHGVHDITHLPWVASIPLTALLVRTVVGLPLQIYTKYNARRERDIAPLKQAWATWASAEKKKQLRGTSALTKALRNGDINKHFRERLQALNQDWRISLLYRYLPIVQLPVWIVFMESIRGMSGNKNVEPTFATEGALWFPDLLVGDSTGILPALLTASILLNVQAGWKMTPRADIADMPRREMFQAFSRNGLRVFIQVLALNVGLSSWFYDMPVALMIYWISSSNIATLQNFFLEKNLFTKPPMPLASRRYVEFHNPDAQDPFHVKLR